MKQFYLTEIITKDNLIHQGVFYKPSKKPSSTKASPGKAILWVHGLTDNFYGDVKTFEVFVEQCQKEGLAFASFNNRGHDVVTSNSKIDPKTPKGTSHVLQGAAIEQFKDSVFDIEASVNFLAKEGFSEVVLVGISTGANKVCYYAANKSDPRVIGVVLASAISDVGFKTKELGSNYKRDIDRVKQLVKKGKGDELINGLDYMPVTPNRYISLYEVNGTEDVFPYYQKKPRFVVYSKITKPLMVILGQKDEYADMSINKIVDIYEKYNHSENFHRVIVEDAFHSFGGKEKEFVRAIMRWVTGL